METKPLSRPSGLKDAKIVGIQPSRPEVKVDQLKKGDSILYMEKNGRSFGGVYTEITAERIESSAPATLHYVNDAGEHESLDGKLGYCGVCKLSINPYEEYVIDLPVDVFKSAGLLSSEVDKRKIKKLVDRLVDNHL